MNVVSIHPDGRWLEVLAEECHRSSQTRVASRLGVSPAMVNQALKGVYKGDINTLRERVEGAFMGRTCDCPVLGEIPANECIEHQARPFSPTNSQRVRLYKACRICPHSHIGKEKNHV